MIYELTCDHCKKSFTTAKPRRAIGRRFCSIRCTAKCRWSRLGKTPRERFDAGYVKLDNGCWKWKGALDVDGYGWFNIKVAGKNLHTRPHRVAMMLAGFTLTESDVVMHSCDNPSCVNPAHLSIGTQRDNIVDCISKGRFLKRSDNLAFLAKGRAVAKANRQARSLQPQFL